MPDPSALPRPEPEPEVLAVLGRAAPARRRRTRLLGILFTLLGVTALLGGGWALWQRRQEAARPQFVTGQVRHADIRVTVSATGTLQGLNTVEVGSEVSGKLTQVNVDYNDPVSVGQVLAIIDPEQSKAAVDEANAQVASAEASILQAKATLAEARQKLERAKGQLDAGLISRADYETLDASTLRAEATLKSSIASATLARAGLKSAQSRLEKTTIISPIDGIVLSRLVEPGQTVAAGMTTPVLFKLTQDLRKMSLKVAVDEADIGRVKEGQEASFRVDTYPEKVFVSEVLSLRNEPVTLQNVVTYEAILSVDNSELLLRPGMTAAATIVIETRANVLTVPNAALRFTPTPEIQKAFRLPGVPQGPRKPRVEPKTAAAVWVLQGGTPRRIELPLGASDGENTEVQGGALQENDDVIVDVEQSRRP